MKKIVYFCFLFILISGKYYSVFSRSTPVRLEKSWKKTTSSPKQKVKLGIESYRPVNKIIFKCQCGFVGLVTDSSKELDSPGSVLLIGYGPEEPLACSIWSSKCGRLKSVKVNIAYNYFLTLLNILCANVKYDLSHLDLVFNSY